jgi:capsule polysaccharide export protein KpsE/RkpR
VQERDRQVLEMWALAHTARAMISQLQRELADVEAAADQASSEEAADVQHLAGLAGSVGVRQLLAAAEKVRTPCGRSHRCLAAGRCE